MASALATARSIVALSSAEPTRIWEAASAHSGVSDTLVSPIEALAHLSPAMVRMTAAAAVA
jgi:hypothetical protein